MWKFQVIRIICFFQYSETISKIISVKKYEKIHNIKRSKVDIRMCIWLCFQSYKLILDNYKLNLTLEDENNYLDEYLNRKKIKSESKKILIS